VYDCRIFAATGVDVTDDGKPHVAARVSKWRFAFATPMDEALERSMRRAAAFIQDHPECASGGAPLNASNRGVAAFAIASLFAGDATPSVDQVRAAIRGRLRPRRL
jgi:hypothetical protein